MNTSACATSRRSTAWPAGERRSSARLFLLRPSSSNPGLLASPDPTGGVARRRYGSPAPGGSILITSAPKSDITVAAAGPAIKLAQSITFKPSKTRSPINPPPQRHLLLQRSSGDQAECVAVAHDMTGCPAGEMRADDQDRVIAQAGQHQLTRAPRRIRIGIRGGRPVRA